MKEELEKLRLDFQAKIQNVSNLEQLDALELDFFGRKGQLTVLLKGLSKVSGEERPVLGKIANELKTQSLDLIKRKKQDLVNARYSELANKERVDMTEPGLKIKGGHLHFVTQTIKEITSIFEKIGFYRTRYPEVDWDWYAFESLNMPPDHPARDEWETFFMTAKQSQKGKMVLTPHTSNAQAHELEKHEFPIRMLNISKTYRRQSDATHAPMFHQFEGLYVDKNVNLTHLRGILDYFAKEFFGEGRVSRIRPHHFRFTEPSFEIDISCDVCGATGIGSDGKKCKICKQGWLEIGGAGMVHPNVLKASGIDPHEYSGLAFGWGIERVGMMKEGTQVDDIRILYQNDIRFLKQF